MRRATTALVAGVLFGAGLSVSGIVDPARVRGFLDVFWRWDPTLAFVMAGALIPMAIAWRIQSRMNAPVAGGQFQLPPTRPITPQLAGGATLFGIGWGLAGLCPGPAFAGLAIAPRGAPIFLLAMFAGMALFRIVASIPRRQNPTSQEVRHDAQA